LANINSQDASSGFALDSSGNLYWLDGNSSIDELAVGSHNVATLVNLGSKVQLTSLFTDDEGNLYAGDLGDTLYEIPAGTHSPELFQGPSDGVSLGDVTLDNKGNLFDITTRGGTHGYGELFEISAGTHTLRVVASLPNTHLVGPPAGGGVEADATGNLYITIGDPFGSSSIVEVSGSGFVVAPSAPVIFTQPSSQSTLAGDNVTFTAVDNSTPAPTVQWQESDDDGKPFRDITGNASATTQTLRLNEVAASQNGTRYRAIFTNGLGFLVSDVVKLAVEPLVLVSPAHASESTGTSTTATLSALGDATDGEAGLTYQWSLVRLPAGAIRPTFTENGSNAARHTTVTFHKAGDYLFRCTISDGSGDRVRSDVQVEVAQEATSLRLTPHDQTVAIGKDITFHGAVYDQFGKLMLDQSSIQYLIVSGPGTIDPSSGVFSSSLPGAALIEASDGDLSGTAGLGVIVA
jgi:plastocyanin